MNSMTTITTITHCTLYSAQHYTFSTHIIWCPWSQCTPLIHPRSQITPTTQNTRKRIKKKYSPVGRVSVKIYVLICSPVAATLWAIPGAPPHLLTHSLHLASSTLIININWTYLEVLWNFELKIRYYNLWTKSTEQKIVCEIFKNLDCWLLQAKWPSKYIWNCMP